MQSQRNPSVFVQVRAYHHSLIIINFDLNCKKFCAFFLFSNRPPAILISLFSDRKVFTQRAPLCTLWNADRCSFGCSFWAHFCADVVHIEGSSVVPHWFPLCIPTQLGREGSACSRACSSLRRTANPRPLEARPILPRQTLFSLFSFTLEMT